jgi:hypothetical protein
MNYEIKDQYRFYLWKANLPNNYPPVYSIRKTREKRDDFQYWKSVRKYFSQPKQAQWCREEHKDAMNTHSGLSENPKLFRNLSFKIP